MTAETFSAADIGPFLELARQEKWMAQRWEMEFLIDSFPEGCRVVRGRGGDPIGFVTSLPHAKSGWVGNLLVAAEHRREGIGEKLFRAALQALMNAEVATVWLTASSSGKRLYEKHGFRRIDTVNRWKGSRSELPLALSSVAETPCTDRTVSIDAAAWGDTRKILLKAVMGRGRSTSTDGGFVTLQACGDCYQIGPLAACSHHAASELLIAALAMAPPAADIYLDAPESNRSATMLLHRMGWRTCGANELMYLGEKPPYRPELLYALATMGSCG